MSLLKWIPLLFIPTVTLADGHQRIWGGSQVSQGQAASITLHEPTVPDAVATLTFVNREVHTRAEDFTLVYEGIEVLIYMKHNDGLLGEESIEVIPLDGYIAIPSYLQVRESDEGVVHIYEYRGN